MKTIIVILIVAVIAVLSMRSVIKSFKGEGGCSCSGSCGGDHDHSDKSCCSDKKLKK